MRKKSKKASVVAAEKALAETLRKSGYTALEKGGVRSRRPDMPEFYGSFPRRSTAENKPVTETINIRERSTYDPDFSVSEWAKNNGD